MNSESRRTPKILIVDDHKMFAQVLSQSITQKLGEESCCFYNIEDLLSSELLFSAQILLLDVKLENGDSISFIKDILKLNPELKIIIISMFLNMPYIQESIHKGAMGYLTKSASLEELAFAIKKVLNGQTYISSKVKGFADMNHPEKEWTKREAEIVLLICEGFNNRQISEKLNVSYSTIETHKRNAMSKVDCHSVQSLMVYCKEHGIF